jgi:hypothetical protein
MPPVERVFALLFRRERVERAKEVVNVLSGLPNATGSDFSGPSQAQEYRGSERAFQ